MVAYHNRLSFPYHLTAATASQHIFIQYHLRLARSFTNVHMNPTVPSIDFKPFLCGSSSDRLGIASEIDEALSSVGFFQLRNHGIEQYKVDACFQWVC